MTQLPALRMWMHVLKNALTANLCLKEFAPWMNQRFFCFNCVFFPQFPKRHSQRRVALNGYCLRGDRCHVCRCEHDNLIQLYRWHILNETCLWNRFSFTPCKIQDMRLICVVKKLEGTSLRKHVDASRNFFRGGRHFRMFDFKEFPTNFSEVKKKHPILKAPDFHQTMKSSGQACEKPCSACEGEFFNFQCRQRCTCLFPWCIYLESKYNTVDKQMQVFVSLWHKSSYDIYVYYIYIS